jgi:hypothetical protein
MKIEIEPMDIYRGAEFICNEGVKFLVVDLISGATSNALVNLKTAKIITTGDENIIRHLTIHRAHPAWLYNAILAEEAARDRARAD